MPTPKFKSKFEARIYAEAYEPILYEPKDLVLDYQLTGRYHPDFLLPNGIIVETKGAFPYKDRRKMLAVKLAHPDKDIRLVFMRANVRCARSTQMTYGDWATKNGFLWSDGDIPKEWFLEEKKKNEAS